jgi:hypothetical protein
MKKALTIIRVSRKDQLKGYGPDVQWLDDVLPNAPILGLEVSEELKRVIQEPATGWDRDRFQEAVREGLRYYHEGKITALLFPRVDRETRFVFGSFPLLCEVIRAGLEVYFARDLFRLDPFDTDSVQKYMNKAIQAQAYTEEWTKTSADAKRKRAENDHMMPTGRSKWAYDYHPYRKDSGHKPDAHSGKYTVNKERVKWVKRWADWLLIDGISIIRIAKIMRDKYSIPISRSTIADILSDDIVVGKVYAYKTKTVVDAAGRRRTVNTPKNKWLLVYEDDSLRILTDQQFHALKEKFKLNCQNSSRHTRHWYPPLRSIIFCVCGRRMAGITLGGVIGKTYYRCLKCRRYIKAVPLWEEIKSGVKKRLLQPELLIPAIKAQLDSGKSIARLEEDLRLNQQRLDILKQAEIKALRLYLYTPDDSVEMLNEETRRMAEQRQRLECEGRSLEGQLTELKQAMVDEEGLRRFCDIAARNLDSLDDGQWRILLETMKLRVLVNDTVIPDLAAGFANGSPLIQQDLSFAQLVDDLLWRMRFLDHDLPPFIFSSSLTSKLDSFLGGRPLTYAII